MKKIYILSGLMCLLPGLSFGENPRIAELTRSKQEKMERLQKCEGTTKALKIAGLSTIGLTAVGVVGNVVESQKLQTYQGQSNALDTQIAQTKKEIEDKKAEIAKKKQEEADAKACMESNTGKPLIATMKKNENGTCEVVTCKPNAQVNNDKTNCGCKDAFKEQSGECVSVTTLVGYKKCNVDCNQENDDKEIACQEGDEYKAYKCSNYTWIDGGDISGCNNVLIADKDQEKIGFYNKEKNIYLFKVLNGKDVIAGTTNTYLKSDVCHACEHMQKKYDTKKGQCITHGWQEPCDSSAKKGEDCNLVPNAKIAKCEDRGLKSNGEVVLNCAAKRCNLGYYIKKDNGLCITTKNHLNDLGDFIESWSYDFDDTCYRYDGNNYDSQNKTDCAKKYLKTKGEWYAEFANGTVYGLAKCSNDGDDNNRGDTGSPSNTHGKNCWCKTGSEWVYCAHSTEEDDAGDDCDSSCADWCGKVINIDDSFRDSLLTH